MLEIDNRCRPDLFEGIVVDSGHVTVAATNTITLASGLGDGYYPIFANYNFGFQLQSLILDFNVWKIRNYVILPGQRLDEFGLPVQDGKKP